MEALLSPGFGLVTFRVEIKDLGGLQIHLAAFVCPVVLTTGSCTSMDRCFCISV